MTAKEKLELIQNEIESQKRGVFLNSDWNKCKEFLLNQLQDFIAQLDTIDENKELQTEGKPIERTDDELEESPDTDLFASNEQKAIELCRKNYKNCNEMLCVGCPKQDFLATLIQMADFKDEQFKEELDHAYHCADHVQYMNGWRDAIEKVEDWLYDLKKH